MDYIRPTYLNINLGNLIYNIKKLLEFQNAEIMPVIKADAYGMGAVKIAKEIESSKIQRLFGFGVSTVEEALELRSAEVKTNIMILGSIYPFKYAYDCIKNSIILPAFSYEALREINACAIKAGVAANVHLKVDTGMGRLGVRPQEAIRILNEIKNFKAINLSGIFSHLSSINDPEFTLNQIKQLKSIANGLNIKYIHLASSGGILRYPEAHFNLTRPGIALYGISPFLGEDFGLKRVIEFKTKIVFIKKVPANTPISYARTFITKRPSKIATIPVGYADGYRRDFSNKSYVTLNGIKAAVVGRVTMDHTMIDVTDINCKVGDEVTLFGEAPSIYELSKWGNTIPYEIMTGISKRVYRIYIK